MKLVAFWTIAALTVAGHLVGIHRSLSLKTVGGRAFGLACDVAGMCAGVWIFSLAWKAL